jgi:hypothetical protein
MPGIVSQKWTLKNISQNIDDIVICGWHTYLNIKETIILN